MGDIVGAAIFGHQPAIMAPEPLRQAMGRFHPEGFFGHYPMLVGALGGRDCRIPAGSSPSTRMRSARGRPTYGSTSPPEGREPKERRMTLEGWTLPQTRTGRASTVPPPPWHYSGDIIAVDFMADPARVAELVPAGFSPRGDGSCTLFFCDWCSAAERDPRVKDDPIKGQYREAYVTLNGTFDGRPFGRVPYIWVDSELSLLRGRSKASRRSSA